MLEFDVDGSGRRVYASGIRNRGGARDSIRRPGQLWVATNERDNLGDNLVPDYISHVEEGGFYGWPWYYLGGQPGPAARGQASGLKDTVKVPDVLLQPHSAPARPRRSTTASSSRPSTAPASSPRRAARGTAPSAPATK